MVRTLQVAVSGLGRMGARHALHFLEKTPRASLAAVCDPDPQARAWATTNLAPHGTKVYSDFDEMLKHPGLEAVCVAGITTEHAPQAIRAIEPDKHVLCEKPLSVDVEMCEAVVEAAGVVDAQGQRVGERLASPGPRDLGEPGLAGHPADVPLQREQVEGVCLQPLSKVRRHELLIERHLGVGLRGRGRRAAQTLVSP